MATRVDPYATHGVDAFARRILFGAALDDKLAPAPARAAGVPPAAGVAAPIAAPVAPPGVPAAIDPPDFPARPPEWAREGRRAFPSGRALRDPHARGEVLHFFANHELLALEIMALALLRFPDAPAAFRAGLVRTMAEEQSHLRLYLERMRELGVEFGTLPLSDFFWTHMRSMRSPLDFVTQMSLTFEQANLDFSVHYRDAVARHGDARTAAVLDRVYREEIGHVKHGLEWFNRWRDRPGESDWGAYVRLLPPPLTPRRARGVGFCAEARRAAGFSPEFVRELLLHGGSRGRPPVVWLFNPDCEAEIVREGPGPGAAGASSVASRIEADLTPVLFHLAGEGDIVVAGAPPRREWLQHLVACGFRVPEIAAIADVRAIKLGGCEPWGWSPRAHRVLRPLAPRIAERRGSRGAWQRRLLVQADFAASGLGALFSKAWAAEFLRRWLDAHPATHRVFGPPEDAALPAASASEVRRILGALLAKGRRAVLKSPWGTAGRGLRFVASAADIRPPLEAWIERTLASQGRVLVEPWHDRVHDLSLQIEARPDGAPRVLAAREFCTTARGQYCGTILGRNFWHLTDEARRLVDRALPLWRELARDFGAALTAAGYLGPAGLDALVHRDASGALRLAPLVEANPRWTMGRVGLELERHVAPGVRAAWVMHPAGERDVAAIARAHPPVLDEADGRRRIRAGIVLTTDPATARALTTALVVGADALASPLGPPARAARARG